MRTISQALAWTGTNATASMFVVFKSDTSCEPALAIQPAPVRVRRFPLEDVERVLPAHSIIEYDLVFERVPPNLDDVLRACLGSARASGAELAWFGFEGSFSFEHLLSGDIADQVYALVDDEGVALASDATLLSDAWRQRVTRAGEQLSRGSGSPPRV